VPDWLGCVPLNEVPQPVRAITHRKSNIHSALRDRLPEKPRNNNGIGDTSASMSPDGEAINRPLVVVLMVNFVLSGAPPESVGGAKLQAHPLGSPEQAKDNEALNPFSGATETVKDPGVPCVMLRALLERVSAKSAAGAGGGAEAAVMVTETVFEVDGESAVSPP
jgi:hypothetical protein